MQLKNYKLSATIPTGNYANIQPSIEIETDNIEEASKFAISHVREMFNKYSNQPLMETQEVVDIKSFTEDITVKFDKTNHKYTYNNQVLTSATQYVKQFYKEFDPVAVSINCEKSWGVPAQTIQELWKSNGDITADFGTVVHKALEHYFLHKNDGETIMKNREKDDNPALPKHPYISNIILDFVKLIGDTNKDKAVLTELFVTDSATNTCGLVDRLLILDEKKKVCRIQDYKINIDSADESNNLKALAPYDTLPANKLTKYQIQLSFYANILKKHGWTVEGLDVFVLEQEWKHYKLDVLEIKQ